MATLVREVERQLKYPIEIDRSVIEAGPPPVTLRVEGMKIRYITEFITKLTGLQCQVLPDRLRLVAQPVAVQPAQAQPDAEPHVHGTAQ